MARPTDTDRHADAQAQAGAERTRVGHILRSARLSRDEDLKDVAAKLRIRHPYLDAIEEGRLADLPGPTYAVGFVRAYADYLGLETEDVVARFKADSRALDAKAELVFPEPLPGSRAPGFALLLVALVLGGLVYGGWLYISAQDRPVADIIPAVPGQLAELIDGARSPAPQTADTQAEALQPDVPQSEAPQTADPQTADPQTAAPETTDTQAAPQAAATPTDGDAAAGDDAPAAEAAPAPAAPTEPTDAADAPAEPAADAAAETAADSGGDAAAGTTPQPPIRSDAEIAAEAERAARQAADEAAAEAERQAQQQAAQQQAAQQAQTVIDAQSPTSAPSAESQTGVQAESQVEPAPSETASASPPDTGSDTGSDTGAGAAPAVAPSAPAAPTAPEPGAPVRTGDDGAVFGAASAESRVSITARVASWIEVTGPTGDTLMARLLRAGETYRAPDRAGITLVTGNAGGLEIVVDGTRAPDIGPLGAVRRNVSLDPEKLKAGVAAGG